MKLNQLNVLRHGVNVHRHCFATKNYGERLVDFPNTYTWEDADRWYKLWEKHKYFEPSETSAESFKMILPPPNVTGVLHLGHALTSTVQDVLARWHRMKKYSVIWVPGLDHAGIATQAVVEKYLQKNKGVGRYDLGKEEFISHIEDWKNEKGDGIRNQLKTLGASLDWSREYFTMSQEHNQAVTEAFLILNQRKLLYRNKALINWSPALRSAISDMEIEQIKLTEKTELYVPGYERKVRFGQIAQVAFKLQNSEDEIVIATTRPETMLGDTAIAVHPEDERYSRFINQQVWHPLRKTFIPIIEDTMVKRDFGTGVVKITPAHDHNDLAVAKRHNLEIIDVIGNDGKIISNSKAFEGLGRFEAREKILNELANQGLLRSLENHEMMVPICSRSGDIVEYLIREQWFLKTQKMAERAAEAVKSRSLNINPQNWAETWCDWLGNNRDWCVSRQIWWGHRIPAYRYQDREGVERWIVARSEEEARNQISSEDKKNAHLTLEQDEDVLDTWFSSALLPLSAMGWPNRPDQFEKNYPLSLMETGHDIIFLWVARMVMIGLELTGTLPFKEVLFHGILCDAEGKKMSKSRGNVVKPEHVINGISLKDLNAEAEESWKAGILSKEEMKRSLVVNAKMFPDGIEECGPDALRLTLCSQNFKNSRISFNVIECRTNKYFCNKIWQASKYILRMTDDTPIVKPETLTEVDRWILSRLSHMVFKVNDAFQERQFYKAVPAMKQFFHHEFCDFFVEATKLGFQSERSEIIASHRYCLTTCLEVFLRVLAPITPHLADDLYARCAKKLPTTFLTLPSLLEARFPTYDGELKANRAVLLEDRFELVLKVACAIRIILPQISKKSEFEVHVVADSSEVYDNLYVNVNLITAVTRVKNIEIAVASDYKSRQDSMVWDINGADCRVFILLNKIEAELTKSKMEKKRLSIVNQLKNLEKHTCSAKYANKNEAEKLQDQEQIKNLQEELRKYPMFI